MKPASAEKESSQFASGGITASGVVADGRVGAALWTARPSLAVALLSALIVAYMGGALFFAGLELWTPGDYRVLGFAAAALLVIAVATQIRWAFGIVAVLAASYAAQYHWALLLDPQPFGEFGQLWELASRLAASIQAGAIDWSTLHASPSLTATGVYAVSIWALGDDFGVARLVASGLWTVQVYLVWRIAREISELRARAFVVALIFGLSPTMVVFGGLPSVESVFGLFALTALYLMLSHRRRGLLLSAFLSGVAAGLAFLTQPAAIGYGFALLALLLFGLVKARGWRPRFFIVMAIATCAIGVGVGFSPQIALNYQQSGKLSIAPGPTLGYQLLLGTNRVSGGGYSYADLARVGFVGDSGIKLPPAALAAAGREGQRIAIERVKADPVDFAVFALTEKLRKLWGSEREMLSWSVSSPSAQSDVFRGSDFERYAPLAVAGAYLALLLTATLGAARLLLRAGAVTDPARWMLLLGALVGLAVVFMALEARERHHLAFAPLLALLAPLPFARLPWIARDAEQVDAVAPALPYRPAPAAAAVKPAPRPKPQPATADMPVEARLAVVLKGMSKPPRPPEEGAEKPRKPLTSEEQNLVAPPKPAGPPRSLVDDDDPPVADEPEPPAAAAKPAAEPKTAQSPLVAAPSDRPIEPDSGPSKRRIPAVLAPPVTPPKKQSSAV